MKDDVLELMARVKTKNPCEPEFHQAVQEVAESLTLVLDRHPEYRQYYRTNYHLLCQVLIALGNYPAVPATAAEMVAHTTDPAGDAYDAACFVARCVPLAGRDARLFGPARHLLGERYAGLAMTYLRQAVRHGYKDAAHTRKDSQCVLKLPGRV